MKNIIKRLFPHYFLRKQIRTLWQGTLPLPSREGLRALLARLPEKTKAVAPAWAEHKSKFSFILNFNSMLKIVPVAALLLAILAAGLWYSTRPSNSTRTDILTTEDSGISESPASPDPAQTSQEVAARQTADPDISALFASLDQEAATDQSQALASEYDNSWLSEEDSSINDLANSYDPTTY